MTIVETRVIIKTLEIEIITKTEIMAMKEETIIKAIMIKEGKIVTINILQNRHHLILNVLQLEIQTLERPVQIVEVVEVFLEVKVLQEKIKIYLLVEDKMKNHTKIITVNLLFPQRLNLMMKIIE